eukprot:10147290-Lingulodinium_polyedra.AAC.1
MNALPATMTTKLASAVCVARRCQRGRGRGNEEVRSRCGRPVSPAVGPTSSARNSVGVVVVKNAHP